MVSRFTAARAVVVAACLLSLATAGPASAAQWFAAGRPAKPLADQHGFQLPDGNVLFAGDGDAVNLYDPDTGRWTAGPPMAGHHAEGGAVQLPDGRVLVAGGQFGWPYVINSTEIFDPVTRKWSSAGTLNVGRTEARAAVLADGRVLLVGGDGVLSAQDGAELWDPVTNAWTRTGPMSKVRADTVVAVLPDGRVLAAGGRNLNDHYLSSAEIYDPVTNSWSTAPSMSEPRSDAYAAPLPGGKVLVAGGSIFKNIDTGGYPYTSDTAEIYDPTAGNWTPAGDLNVPRGNGADMVSLPGGRALILGGYHYTMVDPGPPATWSGGVSETSAEIYDPSTNAWTLTPTMAFARNGAAAVALDDGSVLVAGGINNTAERFADVAPPNPPIDPVATPTPTATATATPTPEATPEATPAAPGSPAPTATPAPAPSTIAFAKLPKRFLVSRTGTFTVTLSCNGTAACGDTVLVRLRAGKRTIIARTKVSIRPGKTASVRVRLSKADSRRLARRTTPVTFEFTTQKLKVNTTLHG